MTYTTQELTAVLQSYKTGKASLERRVIAAENWWRLRNRFEEAKRPGAAADDFRAVSDDCFHDRGLHPGSHHDRRH